MPTSKTTQQPNWVVAWVVKYLKNGGFLTGVEAASNSPPAITARHSGPELEDFGFHVCALISAYVVRTPLVKSRCVFSIPLTYPAHHAQVAFDLHIFTGVIF